MNHSQRSTFQPQGRLALLLVIATLAGGRVAGVQAQTPLGIGPVDIDCASDKTVMWGTAWSFDKPKVRDLSCDGGPVSVDTVYTRTNSLCGRSFQVSRKWEVTDACGFSDSCKQVVTVLDPTQPTLIPVANKTVECGEAWRFDEPAAYDAFSGAALLVVAVSGATNHLAAGLINATCVWETVDACGNKAQCIQTVSVMDTRPPMMITEADKSVEVGAGWAFDEPTALDECSGAVVAVEVASTTTNVLCGKSFTATRHWIATDASGNVVTRSQTITVLDGQPPVLSCVSGRTVEAGTPWAFDVPTAVDAADGLNVILSAISTVTNIQAPGIPVVTRVWRASDSCGNTTTCSQTITVRDTQAPVLPVTTSGRSYGCFADVLPPAMMVAQDLADGSLLTFCITTTNGSCPAKVIHTWSAADSCGNTTSVSQTNLVFVAPPQIVSAPVDQLACVGQRAVLCVQVGNSCGVTFEWSRNGLVIAGETRSCLTLGSITPEDAGNYCVRVLGDFCADGAPLIRCFALVVRPELAAPPLADAFVCEGETTVLSAPMGGIGPFRYSWRKDGSALTSATNEHLVINSASAASVGIYTVEITGPCSSQTASGTVSILPRTDATPLSNLSRHVGESATFNTAVFGPSPLTRLWRHNGIVISGAAGDTLTIPSVRAFDGGVYSVEIVAACGSLTRSAVLTVAATPPVNTAPVISTVPDLVLEHHCRSGEIPFMVSDGETPSNGLLVTATSSNPMLLPTPYVILGGTGADRTVSVVAPSAGAGTVMVTLTVSDGQAVSSTSFTVTIRPSTAGRSRLTIITHGEGQVLPNLNGQELVLGQSYTVRATPSAGAIFSGWEAGASGEEQVLTFVMTPNLVLDASFAPNPFLNLASAYNGLFHESDEVRHHSSGGFNLTMNNQGRFTGSLQIGGTRLRLSGKFDAKGNATNIIRRVRNSPLVVEMHIGLDCNPDQISGVVKGGLWTASLLADRASFHARTNAAPFAGRYTMIIHGCGVEPAAPSGDSFATVLVSRGGLVTFVASLADGARVVRRVPVYRTGQWPLYAPLYRGQGSVLSWQTFENRPADDLHGVMSWIRPAVPGTSVYQAGFTIDSAAVGSRYTAPAPGGQVLSITEGIVAFSGAGTGFANLVTLLPDNRVLNHSDNQMAFTIARPTGLFRGTVLDPMTLKPTSFRGALLQKQNRGAGFCVGADHGARVTFEAQ